MKNSKIDCPLVSICIPVYNCLPFIEKAIQSALSQDYPNYEVVICDDNTTDGTWDLLKNIKDPKVRVFRNSVNLGNHGNHNQTVFQAKGAFIKFLHDDDELPHDALSSMLPWLLLYPNVVATVAPFIFIDEFSEVLGKCPTVNTPLLVTGIETLHSFPLWGNQLGCTGNILVRKESYKAVGGMDVQMKYYADLDLFAKLSTIGDWIHLPDSGYRYRVNNITSLTYTLRDCNNSITAINEYLTIAERSGSNLRAYTMPLKEIIKWQVRSCAIGLQSGLSLLLHYQKIYLLKYIFLEIHRRKLKLKTLWHIFSKTIPLSLRYSYYRRVTRCGFKPGDLKKLSGIEVRMQ